MALSPMMKQYMEIKDQNKDSILFFRLGDFYEMFFDDAQTASRELELTLTGKNCGLEERAPMCGVPYHSADMYIDKLIQKGYKVAICEQTEDPQDAKGIVKREVVRIITPGTVTSPDILNEKENNYLACVYIANNICGFSYCDISTGEIYLTEIDGADIEQKIINELAGINPSEILINDDADKYISVSSVAEISDAFITAFDPLVNNLRNVESMILRQFKLGSLSSLGISDKEAAISSLGAMLVYLEETQMQMLTHLMMPKIYASGSRMALDKQTIRNLEITETLYDKSSKGSLLGVLDRCHTAMGSRKMKKWLREPLNDADAINERLDAVNALFMQPLMLNNIKESLKPVYDFERLAAKVSTGSVNAKDMIALAGSLAVLPDIKMDAGQMGASLLKNISNSIDTLDDIQTMIDGAIKEDPPFSVREGGLINDGYSDELDELKDSISDAKKWIADLESNEKDRTGITNLKVGYNKVFGYYLEITRSWYDHIPENYIRKQTLANAERFITPELKEMESLVLNAETKINDLEYKLFTDLREKVRKVIPRIQQTSQAVAMLDVICSFADVSLKNDYTMPTVDSGDEILIERGRHPVVENTMQQGGAFVPNDTYINRSDSRLLLITGPNMSGKSTYMRQTAIIVLMAQVGCFVPCERAHIGVCDRIFTRIGAADNLAAGESTFYIEMSELAYILRNAGPRSLIILDEIGRGTSTYDGLSIAWAVCGYLCDEEKRIRTLFASHYHELTDLENRLAGFKNLNVDVAEENGEVVFLHKIVPGSASRSYGIHVARIAGVPEKLLKNAECKLEQLEKSSEEINDMQEHQIGFIL